MRRWRSRRDSNKSPGFHRGFLVNGRNYFALPWFATAAAFAAISSALPVVTFGRFEVLVEFIYQRHAGWDVQLEDFVFAQVIGYFTSARSELPCAATITRSPLLMRGRISSSQ